MIHACKVFKRIDQQGCGGPEQLGGLGGDHRTVRQLDRRTGHLELLSAFLGRYRNFSVGRTDLCLLHQKFDLIYFTLLTFLKHDPVRGIIVAPDDLHAGSFLAYLIVDNAVSGHVDTHVGGGFVDALTIDRLKHGGKDRKDLDITVIVDSRLPIRFQMERIDHVDIVKVRCSCLIRQVDRMLERNVPDRESLELCIAGLDSAHVVMIKLRKTGSHLAAARTGSRNDHERPGRLDIIIFPEPVRTDDMRNIGRITVDHVMKIHSYIVLLHPLLKQAGGFLSPVHGDHDAAHIKSAVLELTHQTPHINVIGDP